MGNPSGYGCSPRGSRGGQVRHASMGLAHSSHVHHVCGVCLLRQGLPVLGASARYRFLALSNSAALGIGCRVPLVQPLSSKTNWHRTWRSCCIRLSSCSGFHSWRHVGSGASMRSNPSVKRDRLPARRLQPAPYLQRLTVRYAD